MFFSQQQHPLRRNPGYSYFNPRPNPPTGAGVALLAGLGVLAVSGFAMANAIKAAPILPRPANGKSGSGKGKADEPTPSPLSGVYAPGATVAASNFITGDLRLPAALTVFPITESRDGSPTQTDFSLVTQVQNLVIRSSQGDLVPLLWLTAQPDGEVAFKVDQDALLGAGIGLPMADVLPTVTYADGTAKGARTQVSRLVTDLTAEAAEIAWDFALFRVNSKNDLFDEASITLDNYTREALKTIGGNTQTDVDKLDWSRSPNNLVPGTPAYRTWYGVQLLGQLAYQTIWNKKGG